MGKLCKLIDQPHQHTQLPRNFDRICMDVCKVYIKGMEAVGVILHKAGTPLCIRRKPMSYHMSVKNVLVQHPKKV